MFPGIRRKKADAGVQFCDACAEVTTAEQRAQRRYEHTRDQARAWTVLR
jgi:hypothetical protein